MKINIIKGDGCFEFVQHFEHFVNIAIDDNSLILSSDYNYDDSNYDLIKRTYFELIGNKIDKNDNFYLCLISNLIPNTKYNLLKTSHNPRILNSLLVEESRVFEFGTYIIKMSCIKLQDNTKLLCGLDYLFSGYTSHSFMFKKNKDISEINPHVLVPNYNRYNQLLSFKIDHSLMLSYFDEIYITFGGFDYGQFVVMRSGSIY
jgi:hypothetical protein